MGGRREQLGRRAQLDDPPGVHDGGARRERADDREVVADVERGDVVGRRELAHGAEHVGLGRHVEAGRGLVEHDQARPARERHREADALLLAARELVRVAPQIGGVVGQRDLAHDLGDARTALLGARAVPVHLERLAQLGADAQRGVERRGRILRDVRDEVAAHAAPRGAGEGEDVDVADADAAGGDRRAAPRVAEQGQADRRLAGARLADEPEHLARRDRERHLVDDVDLGVAQDDAQALDGDGRLRSAHSAALPRSMPMAARATPSPIRLVPIVSSAIAATGSTTPHGCETSASCVLVDHRAPVGAVRIGREAEEGERGDEADRVRQAEARLDHQRREDVREDLAEQDPPARDAERLGRGHEVALDHGLGGPARHARDARHGREADREHDQPVLGPERRDRDEREHDLRERQDDVHDAHQHVVEEVARVRGHEPDEHAEHEAEDRRDGGDGEQLPAAPQEPAPDVLADVVGAEEQVRRLRVRLADERRGGVRRDVAAEAWRPRRARRRGSSPARVRHSPSALRSRLPGGPARRGDLGHGRDARLCDRAHSRVLSRGVTMIVAMSASRLSMT